MRDPHTGKLMLNTHCPVPTENTVDNPSVNDALTTKERIYRIAAELFAQKGFHATGMSDLEKATGLGRGALYYHIGSKEELLFNVTSRYLISLNKIANDIIDNKNKSAETKLREFSKMVMHTISNDLAELTVCFRETHSIVGNRRAELLELHKNYEKHWRTLLQGLYKEKGVDNMSPLMVKAVLGMHHYSYLWLRPGSSESIDHIADYFSDFVMNQLKADFNAQVWYTYVDPPINNA